MNSFFGSGELFTKKPERIRVSPLPWWISSNAILLERYNVITAISAGRVRVDRYCLLLHYDCIFYNHRIKNMLKSRVTVFHLSQIRIVGGR